MLALNLVLEHFIVDKPIVFNDETFNPLKNKDIDFMETTKSPWILYSVVCARFTLSILGNLVFSLSLLSVIAAWAESMSGTDRPHQERLNKILSLARVFKVLYIISGFGQLLCTALATFLLSIASLPVMFIDLIRIVCNLWMLIAIILMLIDLRKSATKSVRMKRSQLIRIILLVIFQASIVCDCQNVLFQIMGTVAWVIECLLLMWPKTLVDLETPPLVAYSAENLIIGKV